MVVSSDNTTVAVEAGATVTNASGPAIIVSIPALSGYNPRSASIIVNGSATASGAEGITITSGSAFGSTYDVAGTYTRITVTQGGAVSGTTGIALTQTAGTYSASAPVRANIDNAGTITGSGGIAISTGNGYATINSIANHATGTIGAIAANFVTISNEGAIEGGNLSAVGQADAGTSYSIANAGTIQNTGTAATITSPPGSSFYASGTITNTGTITNGSSGAAISTGNQTFLNNNAGGIIASNGATTITNSHALVLNNAGTITNGSSSGSVISGAIVALTNAQTGIITAETGSSAISASSTLNLINAGTINGNVVSTSAGAGAKVDSTAGTINGDVILGAANDTLVADYMNGALVTGITGTIDGGGGTNSLLVNFAADIALTNSPTLPTNFNLLNVNAASGVTVILNNGFATSNGLGIDGLGSLVNDAALTGTVQIGSQGYSLGSFVNNGTITASGTGVYDANAKSLSNTGTIRSTGGSGVVLTQTSGTVNGNNTNSGSIIGVTVGASLRASSLINTGTISGATGVLLDVNSVIDNQAGGTISGTSAAIFAANNSYLLSVANAGTINGNVNLVVTSPSYYGSYNNYWAKAGGILNGNLSLGSGDTLITSVSGSGTSGYSGINGTVNASNSVLRYDVTSDASDTLAFHSGFSSLGYQVASGARVTLGTNGTFGSTLNLAGQGTVAFNGAIATTNLATVNTVGVQQPGNDNLPASTYTLINNGSLITTRNNATTSPGATVYLTQANDVINNGSIAYIDPLQGAGTFYALYTVGAVTNAGTITSSGYGINASSVTNSGTITAGNYAVLVDRGAIVNSGTIASTATAAVGDTSFYGTTYTLTNQAGGVITGVGNALLTTGGTVSNAGTINGNVNLAYPQVGPSLRTGIYIANGGVLNGNLTFGSGTNFLVETGAGYGVTGTIDAGTGTNWIGHQRTGTATVTLGSALPNGFVGEFAVAADDSSQVTMTGPLGYIGNLYVGGSGLIINQLSTTGSVYGVSTVGYIPYATTEMAGFSNRAHVGSVSLTTSAFDNSATVGSASLSGNAVELTTTKGFILSNSGSITNNGGWPAVSLYGINTSANSTVANSGTITGGISASITGAAGTSVSITNSGTITSYTISGYEVKSNTYTHGLTTSSSALLASAAGATSLSLENSGTISGDVSLSGTDVTLVNTGTINGNVVLGSGNDRFVQALTATLAGRVFGGSGNDTVVFDFSGGGTLDATLKARFLGFENFAGTGSYSATGTVPLQTINIEAGSTFEIAAGALLQTEGGTTITGSSGADTVTNRGIIAGNIDLGAGDDRFNRYLGSLVMGTVSGGAGTDRLALYLDETAVTPTPISTEGYSSFEALSLERGVGSVSNTLAFDAVAVNAGRLIGFAGSTISAPQGIVVASGATFGSAGTVNGNVMVNGTLSPGASPGTMTVNGNITLAGGSTTLFEMTPTISDVLIVNGTLAIASGARLDITGNRPLMPGTQYNLITASGGITGGFTTISKAGTVLGFLRQTSNALQLLGTLQLPTGANTQISAITDYLNGTLIAGTATAGIYDRITALVDSSGYANGAAIATLGAQPYASASQLGIDNGLAMAAAARAMPKAGTGLFAIGQGFGAWHNLKGSSAAGIADADQSMGGFLGGVGYRTATLALAAFAGRSYGRQSISVLRAQTRADGTFVGVGFGLTFDAFNVGGSVIWDDSSADTRRILFDGTSARGSYELHTLTLDAHAAYAMPLGRGGWRIGPQLGLTYSHVTRGNVREPGGAFALDVDANRQHAAFLDLDLRLDMSSEARFRPYLSAGWRRKIGGDATIAVAGFNGVSSRMTVAGVSYDSDFANVGAGIDWSMTSRLMLFARGSNAFDGGNGVKQVNAGLRLTM